MSEFERMIVLRTIDRKWTDHIDTMDQLRTGIHLRSYGQINPLRESTKMKVWIYLKQC